MRVLEPIWATKTETASRVRGRIETVLDWAAARGYRGSENPARWRGHIDKLLPSQRKIAKVQHHPALPFTAMPTFMRLLRARGGAGAGALALEFTILTAARTGETIGCVWPELDLVTKVWTVPPERMKAGNLHRIPLCGRAVEILDGLDRSSSFVFGSGAKPMSNMTMSAVLKRMDRDDLTVHGFRSAFRDWAGETTEFPNELVEMALAHTIKDKAEAAYRRGDMLERRRVLMDAWAAFCGSAATAGQPLKLNGN
jgi:integrase